MIRVVRDLSEWKSLRRKLVGPVGFVPTMGALHEGHLALGRRSVAENAHTVFSIFVNPTQFNDPTDLAKYPRTLEEDVRRLDSIGVNYVLAPEFESIYPDGYRYSVDENEFSNVLCGAHRPGHFRGVLTVVMKLLHLAGADRAYFGEKDYQQLELIRGMVAAFFMDVEIVAHETVREADGLAMSSRNLRLSGEERRKAPLFHELLSTKRAISEVRAALEAQGFEVDYVEERKGRRFGDVRLGEVRLIDNVGA